MESNFTVGEIIKLKSGGPKMTVTRVLDRVIHASWFAGSKHEQGAFPFEAVERVVEAGAK